VRRACEAAVHQGVQPDISRLRAAPRARGPHLLLSEDGTRLLGLVQVEGAPEVARLQLLRIFHSPPAVAEPETDGA
jgi:hypothetical protein